MIPLFVSGGEIFVILLFILIFFGSDKIPEIAKMAGKGMREFRKATDDIKREFNSNSSGVMDDIRKIQSDITDTITKDIAEPVTNTMDNAASAIENEYKETASVIEDGYVDPYQNDNDYYYKNQDYDTAISNEYAVENTTEQATMTDETIDGEKPSDTSIEESAQSSQL